MFYLSCVLLYLLVGVSFNRFYPGMWKEINRPLPNRTKEESLHAGVFAFLIAMLIWPLILISDLVWHVRGKP